MEILKKNNTSVIPSSEYLLVHLNGKVLFNLEGIMQTMIDGTLKKYPCLSSHYTMMCKDLARPMMKRGEKYLVRDNITGSYVQYANTDGYTSSFLYHGLNQLLYFGNTDDGVWYSNTWKRKIFKDEDFSIFAIDTIFYDEFLFLMSEDLIDVEDFEFLDEKKIIANFDKITMAKDESNLEIKEMIDAKSLDELKRAYRQLLCKHHPDKTGISNDANTEFLVKITDAYAKFKNIFQNGKD